MASYFDEHDCKPLGDGEEPNHTLHMARLLIDSGLSAEWDIEFERLFPDHDKSPPASKEFVSKLPSETISSCLADKQCPVCLKQFTIGETVSVLPCKHQFHSPCILPWLSKTNSCPFCRQELPTDDKNYEEYKLQKARKKQRDADIETLHDSMFG
ncbi:RNF181 (predicted) [Pycnogonum litorale]